jgi:hypothetical protein
MNPIPRCIAACMAGMGLSAACHPGAGNLDAAPWLLLGAAFFAWLGWRR